MKKAILFVAILATSFTSCKKDRVCTCTETTTTITTTSYPGTTPTTTSETDTDISMVTYTKARKGDAKKACLSSKYSDSGSKNTIISWTSETTSDCTLK
jgi:hypothetical protein